MPASANNIGPGYDIRAIVTAAGGDPEQSILRAATLICHDVDQAALDGAVAAYDHTANVRARALQWARDEAERRIHAVYPPAELERAALRAASLNEVRVGWSGTAARVLSPEEETEAQALRQQRGWVASVWDARTTIAGEIDALATAAEIVAYDIPGSPHWPAPPA